MPRFNIRDFGLARSAYIGAVVHFYDVTDGERGDDLITLYDGLTGSGTLRNPQRLDGDGKFAAPVYADEATIAVVAGLAIDDHETGIITSQTGTPTYAGAVMVPSGADVTNPSYPYTVIWGTALRNANGVWVVGSPTKLTVPAGYTGARLRAQAAWTGIAADAGIQATIYKNGTAVYPGVGRAVGGQAAYTNPVLQVETPSLVVTAGDEFTLVVSSTDATSDLDVSDTWIEMELFE